MDQEGNAEKAVGEERNGLMNDDHVSGVINQMNTRVNPHLVTAMVWASWIAIMLPRMVVVPLLPTIEQTYRVTHAQAGLLMTSYYYIYTVMQIPAGALSDRFGRRRFIIVSLIGSSLASLAFWMVQEFEQMLLFRAIAGFFAGLWYAPSISYLTASVRDEHRGKAMGMALSGPSVSDAVIFLMVGMLGVDDFGWRNYFLIYAFPGFFCGLANWFLVRERVKRTHNPVKPATQPGEVRKVLSNRVLFGILVHSIIFSLAMYSLRTFVPVYLVQSRGLSPSQMSFLMLSYAMSVVLSGPLGGYLVDQLGSGLPSLIALCVMCAVALSLPIAPMGGAIVIVLLLWGLMGQWSINAFSVVLTRLVPPQARGTFLGVQNSCLFFAAATGPLVLGYVADIGGFNVFFASALGLFVLALLVAVPVLKAQWGTGYFA